ncbi:MAG TPA: MFS transporter [Streptosporangiaceae bacterium]|nr:MFS transporter [Streptosporangiaceae bacterium]
MTAQHSAIRRMWSRDGGSLWRHRDFLIFWSGESASMLGSAVSYIAFPLVAAAVLHATAVQMGILAMTGQLPALCFGFAVGVAADRLPLRATMIVADLGRCLLMGWIPVAAALGVLALWQLFAVSFGTGALTLLFGNCYQAYLPGLIATGRLAEGNAKLAASQSAAETGGPGVAGAIAAVGGVPSALIADALSYLVSALALGVLPGRSPRRAGDGERRRIWPDIKAGIQLVWQDPVLRWATASTAVVATFCQLQTAVYFLFMTSGLHLRVSLIGLVFTVAGAIGFVSATLADRIAVRAGIGRLIVAGQLIEALGGILLALAGGSHWAAAAFIVASETSYSVGAPLFVVGFTSVRQARAPERDRGKVIGASRFLSAALMPVASLLGGVLGSVAGLRTALAVGAAGMVIGACMLWRRDILGLSGGPDLGL